MLGIVFVHGVRSSAGMWDAFASVMAADQELSAVAGEPAPRFEYATGIWPSPLKPLSVIPSIATAADSLKEYLVTEAGRFERLVLIGHSQGGLVIQRCLVRMLSEGRGRELARIRRVVLLATPNAGSELLLTLRRTAVRGNPQEAELRPFNEAVADTLRSVQRDIVHAPDTPTDRSCHIPFSVYAGEQDRVVTRASAQAAFLETGVLPGDHFTIAKPDSAQHRTYSTVRRLLMEAVATADPDPPPADLRPAPAPDLVRSAYLRWLTDQHQDTEALIAGHQVRGPLADAPWVGSLVPDGSAAHDRRAEAAYVRRLPAAGLDAAVATSPLPTYAAASGHVDRSDDPAQQGIPVHTLLSWAWRAVILGNPGSGKTTLARQLVLEEAEHAAVQDPHWRLPVLCRAARLVAALTEDTGSRRLPDASAPTAVEPAFDRNTLAALAIRIGWDSGPPTDPLSGDPIDPVALELLVREAVEAGRLLLVVDGLDEVPTRREWSDLAARIGQTVRHDGPRLDQPGRADGNQLLLTSRLVGYHAVELPESIHQLRLRPLRPEDVNATGEYWIRSFAAQTNQGPLGIRTLTERFDRAVARASATDLVSTHYLLVSLISAAAGDAAGRLDARETLRSDLYGFMVEDFLQRAPQAQRPDLLDVHAAFAYQLHRHARNGVLPAAQLPDYMARALADLAPAEAGDWSADLAVRQVVRLGLLAERGHMQYGFLHLTLEEYLAGRQLVARGPVGADPAESRIRGHLGDPRWVEPVRLGLGYLSGADAARFAGLLSALLVGAGGADVARILVPALGELRAVRPEHIEQVVRAVLAEGVGLAESATGGSFADTLLPLLTSTVLIGGRERPREIAVRTIAADIRSDHPAVAAAAARAAERLGLADRSVVESLFLAQGRDSAAGGWAIVRALQAICGNPEPEPARPEHLREVWDSLSEQLQGRLRGVRSALLDGPPIPPTPREQGVLPPGLAPMRARFTVVESLRLETGDPAVLRAFLCLYGGMPFRNKLIWLAEQRRLQAVLRLADAAPAVRRRAAVRLDTVVTPALPHSSGLHMDASWITTDSPLTDRMLRWIGDGSAAPVVAAELSALAADTRMDDAVRGDALAALVVLDPGPGPGPRPGLGPGSGLASGPGPGSAVEPDSPDWSGRLSRYPAAVVSRLTWRLGRARLLLGDAVSEVSISTLLSAAPPGPYRERLLPPVAKASRVLGGTTPRAGEVRHQSADPVFLLSNAMGWHENKPYSLAVALDTFGRGYLARGPEQFARRLAAAGTVAEAFGTEAGDWRPDPLAPVRGETVAEALTALDAIGPALAFLRCWCLDRLIPPMVAQGYAVEGVCLALEAEGDDPASADRTVRRIATALGTELPSLNDKAALWERLRELVWTIPASYPGARALIRIMRLSRRRLDGDGLLRLVERVEDPHQKLRAMELAVAIGVVDWTPDLRAWAAWLAGRIADVDDRDRAMLRLAAQPQPGRFGWDPRRSDPVNPIVAGPLPSDDESEKATPGGASDSLAQPLLRAGVALAQEDDRVGEAVGRAAVLVAAVAEDVLAALRAAGPADDVREEKLWAELDDPGRRHQAARRLRRIGLTRRLELTARPRAAITRLLAGGDGRTAAPLLAVGRLPEYCAEATAWRDSDDRRVADLALLSALELGRFTPDVAAALPRLLTAQDDAVRIRAALASSVRSRGVSGPLRFRLSGIGPQTVAELARAIARQPQAALHGTADLWWTLNDVHFDTATGLIETLSLLMDDREARETLLEGITYIEPDVASQLLERAGYAPEDEQLALVVALATSVADGTVPADGAELMSPGLAALESAASPRVKGRILVLRSLIDPSDAALLKTLEARIDTAAQDPVRGPDLAACAALGLGHVLARATLPEADRAAALDRLRVLCAAPDPVVAAAAAAALARAGEVRWLFAASANLTGRVGADTVMWGLFGRLGMQIGPEYYQRVREITDYVRHPAGLTEADAVRHTDSLLDLLLSYAVADLADESVGGFGPVPPRYRLTDLLTVLAHLADAHPGGMRLAVDSRYPQLRGQLVRLLETAHNWLTRLSTARLLIFLADADAHAVRVLLDTAQDTETVRRAVLSDARWFSGIRPDGLDTLVAALADPRPSRCNMAVHFLGALLSNGVLEERDHSRALRAVQSTLGRADADEPLLAEHDGQMVTTGSIGDSCRRLLAALLSEDEPDALEPQASRLTIRVADAKGDPVLVMLPEYVREGISPLRHQVDYYRDAESRELPESTLLMLFAAAGAAQHAGMRLGEILRFCAELDEGGSP